MQLASWELPNRGRALAAPYLLFLLFDRDARPALRTPGPWLGIALALIIASPHVVWLFDNHFAPFAYVDARSAPASHWWDYIWHPAFFAAGQFFFMLPALVDRRHVRVASADRITRPPRCRRISAPTRSTAASSRCSRSVPQPPCWR